MLLVVAATLGPIKHMFLARQILTAGPSTVTRTSSRQAARSNVVGSVSFAVEKLTERAHLGV